MIHLVIHATERKVFSKGRFKTHMKCFSKVQLDPVSVLITLRFVTGYSSGAEKWCVHVKNINDDVQILTASGSGDIHKFHEFLFRML